MKQIITYTLLLTLLGLATTQHVFRPLHPDTMQMTNTGRITDILYEGYGDYGMSDSSIVTINDKGDFAVIYSDDDSDYDARIAFVSFEGEIIHKQKITWDGSGFEDFGNSGVELVSSGEDDSVIVLVIGENDSGSGYSLIMGILGIDGNWRRNTPIEVFHDKLIDGAYVYGNVKNFYYPKAARSGDIVQIQCQGYVQADASSGSIRYIYYNHVDISGTGDLSVVSNEGTKLVIGGDYSDKTEITEESDCLDLDGQGKIVCTVVTRKPTDGDGNSFPEETFLVEYDNGTYVSSHVVNYETDAFKTDNMDSIESAQLSKIPGTNEFIVAITENDNSIYTVLLKYDISDLDNYTQIKVLQPFKFHSSRDLEYTTIECSSQTQGYLVFTDDNNYYMYMQEFNPTTLELVGKDAVFIGHRANEINNVKMATLIKDGSYKLALSFNDEDYYANQVEVLDLQNQGDCKNLDTKRWVCLECNEGYKLTYEFYCIQGEGFNKIQQTNKIVDIKPLQLPPIEETVDIVDFSSLIKFSIALATFALILV